MQETLRVISIVVSFTNEQRPLTELVLNNFIRYYDIKKNNLKLPKMV